MVNMIAHEDVKKYIQGNINESLLEQISKIRKENVLYQILFDLIDQVDKRSIIAKKVSINKKDLQFAEIELLFEEIVAGSADTTLKNRFIGLLYHSSNFYSRLVTKINQVSPLLDTSVVEELSEVAVKSDEGILASLKEEICGDSKLNRLFLRKTKVDKEKPSESILIPTIRRFVYAIAAVLIIAPSIYFINNQYKTTYKKYTVQNVLKENYRIYMAEQPRISGGYHSTGISQLMAGEDDSLEYLDNAEKITDEILDYELTNYHALHLQAQIMIIRGQYTKADSVLNVALNQESKSPEMLNDLGVVYFGKEEWQKARTFFKLSIKQDLTFSEAYYNLALTELNLGNIIEAKAAVNLFLIYEKNQGWKNAGLNMLNTMEGDSKM